jgi:3-hydroxyisobutyrate dehydrogenase
VNQHRQASDRGWLMAERVAVLGTGIMGAPMARNLLKAGFQIPVWNRTSGKAHVLATEGADQAETPADAVREAAFVITMLTDTAAVLALMGQAAASMPDGAVWLQTSMDTEVERAAGLAEVHGITFVNCPVLGTRETARRGRLVVLASGPATSSTGHSRSSTRSGRRPSGSGRESAGRPARSSWPARGPWRSWRASAPS